MAHLVLHGLPEITKQMMNDKTDQLHKSTLNKDDTHVADLTCKFDLVDTNREPTKCSCCISPVLQLEFKGKCEEIKIALDPPAIYVPGFINPLSTMRKSFRVS